MRGLCFCWFAVSCSLVWASDAPLVTDRPDQTESAVVVPVGSVQIETGFRSSREEDAGPRFDSDQWLGTLVRVGVSNRVELRLGWDGWQELSTAGSPDTSGVGDANVGVKVSLSKQWGPWPEVALIASTSIPSGARDLRGERSDPTVLVALSHAYSDRVSVGYNVGLTTSTERDATGDRDTSTHALGTLAIGFSLTDRLGLFAEVFGDAPFQSGQGAATFDAGLTYLVRPTLQLDLSAGTGLNDTAEDWFVGAGVSSRF